MRLQCGIHELELLSSNNACPKIMAILNVTPDSFSDGGSYCHGEKVSLDLVLKRAEVMLSEGADIIDVGGESTRPGAISVSEQLELDRVIPVVETLVKNLGALVSVDTSTASVMRESACHGASIINDVRALQREGALAAAAQTGLPVCLMHMRGQPDSMQNSPEYINVTAEVRDFLHARMAACVAAGINKDRILLDPGFGFGKTLDHNLALLANLQDLVALGQPVLVGLSRKSILGQMLNRKPEDRLPGSLALAIAAAERGAAIVRVHDVAETRDVLQVFNTIKNYSN